MTAALQSQAGRDPATELIVRPAIDEDAAAWDAYVARHPRGTPYHCYAWRKALEDAYGLDTHYLLAESAGREQLCGVLPAARMPRLLGGGPLCSLPYCDGGEPLADNESVMSALLDALDAQQPCVHELRGVLPLENGGNATDSPSPEPGQKARLLLDLPDSSAALFAGFKSKHRSQIRKAEKNGLVAEVVSGPGAIDDFYRVFTRNMRDLGSPTHSIEWFRAIATAYGDDCRIGIVRLDTTVVGGGIVLRSGDRCAIPWASTLRDFNKLAPNMLLYWSLLSDAADAGLRQFDFGRSTVGEGTFRFKLQWGAQPVPLNWRVRTGSTIETAEGTHTAASSAGRLRDFVERIWRNLPLELTIALGSRVRPWISL
jgi:FemAB-related protein (PEP-CTERM system-associated)